MPPIQTAPVHDRSIGNIIAEAAATCRPSKLPAMCCNHQREDQGVRFGEAAVALGFASKDDVLFALVATVPLSLRTLRRSGASSAPNWWR